MTNDSIEVPIPAGDHNPEVEVLEKQSRFEDDSDLPATPPTGLRASNTVESLKPREVGPTPEQAIAAAVDLLPLGLAPLQTYDPVRKPYTPPPFAPNPSANVLPVDWPTAMKTMGKPKEVVYSPASQEPKKLTTKDWQPTNKAPKTILLPSIYDRVTKLEEQLGALLDRIALHNVRSNHKI